MDTGRGRAIAGSPRGNDAASPCRAARTGSGCRVPAALRPASGVAGETVRGSQWTSLRAVYERGSCNAPTHQPSSHPPSFRGGPGGLSEPMADRSHVEETQVRSCIVFGIERDASSRQARSSFVRGVRTVAAGTLHEPGSYVVARTTVSSLAVPVARSCVVGGGPMSRHGGGRVGDPARCDRAYRRRAPGARDWTARVPVGASLVPRMRRRDARH